MSSSPAHEPLRIALFGFSERNTAMLTQLFSGSRWKDCVLVTSGPIDIGIVELDTPSPDRTWQEYRSKQPHTPTIALSLKEQTREHTLSVKKPVDTAMLRGAIDTLQKQIAESKSALNTPVSTPATARASTLHAADEMGWVLEDRHAGNAPDVDLSDPRVYPSITYDANHYFQGQLEQAIHLATTTNVPREIGGNFPGRLRITPGAKVMVEHSLRLALLRPLCLISLRSIKTAILESEVVVPDAVHVEASAFLWQVALWTARGRLHSSIPLHAPVRLRQWPNLTRLAETPHAMQITATLVSTPLSAAELSTQLKIPQCHVFGFLSAAKANGILELAPEVPMHKPTTAVRPRPLRSLFNRILHALSADNEK